MASSNLHSSYKPVNLISIKELQSSYQNKSEPPLVEENPNKSQNNFKYPPKPTVNMMHSSAEQGRHKKSAPSDPMMHSEPMKDWLKETSQNTSNLSAENQQGHFKIEQPSELDVFVLKNEWVGREISFAADQNVGAQARQNKYSTPGSENRNAFHGKEQPLHRHITKLQEQLPQLVSNKRTLPENLKDAPAIYKTPQGSPLNPDSPAHNAVIRNQASHFVFPGQAEGKRIGFHQNYVGPYETDTDSRQMTESARNSNINTQRSVENDHSEEKIKVYDQNPSQVMPKTTSLSNFYQSNGHPTNRSIIIPYYCSVMEDDVDSDDQEDQQLIQNQDESNVSKDLLKFPSAKGTDTMFHNPTWSD